MSRWAALQCCAAIFSAAAIAQSMDITGWRGLTWGSGKAGALKALQSLHARENGADELIIDDFREDFRLSGTSWAVTLHFEPKRGLVRVTMVSAADRDTFQKALASLTSRYGKPALRAEYDGQTETTRTLFQWIAAHGKASLFSDYGEDSSGFMTVTYEAGAR